VHSRHGYRLKLARARLSRFWLSCGAAALALLFSVNTIAHANHINYGSWNPPSANVNALAIHAALMPTSTWLTSSDSRVFFFGGSQHDPALPFGKNAWRLYNPATGSVTTLNFNGADAFCSGHAHTIDGQLLIVGGNEFYGEDAGGKGWNGMQLPGHVPANTAPTASCGAAGGATMNVHKCEGHFMGHRKVYAFNPAFNTLTELTSTERGHWYPSVLRVTGGGHELLTTAGHIASNEMPGSTGHDNWDFEVMHNASPNWTKVGSLQTSSYYPRGHLTPFAGGTLILNSAAGGTTAAIQFGTTTSVGVPIATAPAEYRGFHASSVLLPLRPNANGVYPPGKIMMTNEMNSVMLDLNNTAAGWVNTPARPNPAAGGGPKTRMHAIATLLATGDVFVSGGYSDPGNETTAVKYTEIWRDDLNAWHEGASAAVGRNYHSTALLLPDGRVWTAGGNKRAGFAQTGQPNGDGRELRVEIFTPWYYNLSRPTIASGFNLWQPPASGTWRINTGTGTTGTSITRVAMIAPGSVTHAFNNDQRYVELRITNRGTSWVEVNVPSSQAILPKGFYMLVISRSSNGNAAGAHIPSVARWVAMP
jgi:hypothetical protein